MHGVTTEPQAPLRARLVPLLKSVGLPLLVLAVLVTAVTIKNPGYLSVGSVSVQLSAISVILLLAIGQTLVIIAGGIDLSSAAIAAFATITLTLWIPEWGVGGILLTLLVTTALGFINGLVHVVMQVPSFVVTLGMLGAVTGLAQIVSGNKSIGLTSNYELIEWITERLGVLPVDAIVAFAITALGIFVIARMPQGRLLRAVGFSELPALMAGAPTRQIKVAVFALSGLMAGMAGLLLTAQNIGGDPASAQSLLMPSIAAVLVGGTVITGGRGGLGLTVIGVAIIVVLRNGLSIMNVPAAYTQLIYGVVVIVAVALSVDRASKKIVY